MIVDRREHVRTIEVIDVVNEDAPVGRTSKVGPGVENTV